MLKPKKKQRKIVAAKATNEVPNAATKALYPIKNRILKAAKQPWSTCKDWVA